MLTDSQYNEVARVFRGDAYGGPRGNVAQTLHFYRTFIERTYIGDDGGLYIVVQPDEWKASRMMQLMASLCVHKPDEVGVTMNGGYATVRLWWD